MRFGREVDDDVGILDQRIHGIGVSDISYHQFHAFQTLNGLGVACVCQLVEDDDLGVGHRLNRGMDEVGAYEAGASRDENAHAFPLYLSWASLLCDR